MAGSSCGPCAKAGRGLRSTCTPIFTVIAFSLMLTYVWVLYHPGRGPGLAQRMGWQSWEVVKVPSKLPSHPSSTETHTEGTSHKPDTSVDWWNVTKPEEKFDSSSLPLDVWSPLLPHDTGLSEIAVSQCLFNPFLAPELCAPESDSERDAIRGKWVRVPRNLNAQGGYTAGYLDIYYRRTRRQDINLITDLRLLPRGQSPPKDEGWRKVSTSLRTGIMKAPPLFLWYKVGKTAAEMTPEEKANIITEIDVLWGDDIPWYGFEKLSPPTMEKRDKILSTWITYRRGVKIAPRPPPLHFSHSGKFKILQVADLHFSTGGGECKDTAIQPCSGSDNSTLNLAAKVLDQEKPDMVIFTGDQLNGQGTTWDAKSTLAKFSRAVTERNIPWALIFGNHDEDDGLRKETQVTMLKTLPYSMVERGPKDVHGVGNYVLKVYSPDASKTHIFTLYFLDSGSYSKGKFDFFGFFTPTEYDWIHQSQIDWFLQESGSIDQIERPFLPDGAKDMGDVWKRQDQITPNTRRLAKPNALMFYHIPIPETYSKADINPITGKPLDVGITGLEPHSAPKQDDGLLEKGILKAKESIHVQGGAALEVKAVGNGHCHITENCRRVKGAWFCFGGGGSYSGYGKIGFDRRFRVYDISDFGETIRTYKRTEKGEIVDEMILAGKGAPPLA